MQITLGEDDSIFNAGVPKTVVISVVFDDGRKLRVPYDAGKTIADLYKQLSAVSAIKTVLPTMAAPIEEIAPAATGQPAAPRIPTPTPTVDKSNVIEREDIVTLVKALPRGEGETTDHLIIGHEYRVLSVHSSGVTLPGTSTITKIVHSYDIINDTAPRPERIRVHPSEVQLLRKRKPPVPKVAGKIEEILACPNCQALNACYLEDQVFKGQCTSCKGDYVIERVIEKCPTDKCGNDVSLFLYNNVFQGKCNKCQCLLEAEHGN